MITRLLGGLLDRVVLVAGTVAGGCLPGFVVQYRQRVGGRLDQVHIDLQPFRDIAARFHGGSLDALIQHHLKSVDQTFHAEGDAIQAMVNSESRLQAMFDALQGSVFDQLWYLTRHLDGDIARATWDSFIPAFNLEASSIAVALVIGVALWLLFVGLWRGVVRLASRQGPTRIADRR
jgi:hypothetical protein